MLAAVIKQPEPIAGGHQGYDPHYNKQASQDRWRYTLDNMVELGWLSAADRAKAEYPEAAPYDPDACQLACVGDKPIGTS